MLAIIDSGRLHATADADDDDRVRHFAAMWTRDHRPYRLLPDA